ERPGGGPRAIDRRERDEHPARRAAGDAQHDAARREVDDAGRRRRAMDQGTLRRGVEVDVVRSGDPAIAAAEHGPGDPVVEEWHRQRARQAAGDRARDDAGALRRQVRAAARQARGGHLRTPSGLLLPLAGLSPGFRCASAPLPAAAPPALPAVLSGALPDALLDGVPPVLSPGLPVGLSLALPGTLP